MIKVITMIMIMIIIDKDDKDNKDDYDDNYNGYDNDDNFDNISLVINRVMTILSQYQLHNNKLYLPLTCSVKRVTKLVAMPQSTPIKVPPRLTTKNDVTARTTLKIKA